MILSNTHCAWEEFCTKIIVINVTFLSVRGEMCKKEYSPIGRDLLLPVSFSVFSTFSSKIPTLTFCIIDWIIGRHVEIWVFPLSKFYNAWNCLNTAYLWPNESDCRFLETSCFLYCTSLSSQSFMSCHCVLLVCLSCDLSNKRKSVFAEVT